MTTLARIEANQRNAALSTGPRTAEGKVVVARNATRHGIFSSVPVVPGECPEAWEAHRAGVVESLAPVGLLEVNLAERAALVLWRLQRLARYEAESVAAGMEDAEVPPLPPPADPIPPPFPRPPQPTRDEQLRDLRHELRKAREDLAGVAPARDYLRSPPEPGSAAVVPFPVAACVLEFGLGRAETSEHARSDPRRFDTKPFLKKLGLAAADAGAVAWTPDLIRRALALYADCAGETPDRLLELVRADLEESAEELERKVRRLEREADAVARLLDGKADRTQAAKLLPADGRDERIARYERHLHNLLTSTLHELERLQARREGEAVPPPAVADVSMTIDSGAV
jgi:hypothetical protein